MINSIRPIVLAAVARAREILQGDAAVGGAA